MQKTEKYELNLPETTDFVNVEHFNENTRNIDKLLCPKYTEEKTLTELSNGEKLATGFGKLAKAVKDLISHIANTAIHFTAEERTKLKGIDAGANAYTHPSYAAKTGNQTANQTPAFGKTFTVTQPISDTTGHIIAMNSRTVTIPSTEATTSAAGLLSATDKTKLNGIATGANKTTIVANLLATVAGYALDATMGKELYDYIRTLQVDVTYLKYLANTSSVDFIEAKYIKNRAHSELGNVNIAYIPYSVASKLTTSNKVIVGFTDGAVGVFDVYSIVALSPTVTWIKGSMPYVSKTTIQNGTNTLPITSTPGGVYTTWDEEKYESSGEVQQTMLLEFSASSQEISTFYKII